MDNDNSYLPHNRRGEHQEQSAGRNHLRLRNVLNVMFMLLAVIGLIVYWRSDQTVGAVIILVGVVFKIVESALRIKF